MIMSFRQSRWLSGDEGVTRNLNFKIWLIKNMIQGMKKTRYYQLIN